MESVVGSTCHTPAIVRKNALIVALIVPTRYYGLKRIVPKIAWQTQRLQNDHQHSHGAARHFLGNSHRNNVLHQRENSLITGFTVLV